MSRRYRLYPTPEQEEILLGHCSHARYVWNLAWNLSQFGTLETYGEASRRKDRNGDEFVYQKRRRTRSLPGLAEQCRMLTEARGEYEWLAAGPQVVQQQSLRDFDQAMRNFYAGTHGRPKRHRKRDGESFRIVGKRGLHWDVRRLSRHVGEVRITKIGWVRFRWSRDVPADVKSFRVNVDHSGRWHVIFAAVPDPIPAPGNGEVVGVDRGVAVSAALSTGEMLQCPGLTVKESARRRKAQRRMDRAPKGSARRETERMKYVRLQAREKDRRRDWTEKTSTDLARRFDVIRVEDLKIANMVRKPAPKPDPGNPGAFLPNGATAKARLGGAIKAQGWGVLVQRTQDKAPGRVEKVRAAYTSMRCSACGRVDAKSRDSQADFKCTACGFACNADVNAAINIAAGHAAGLPPSNREPLPGAVHRQESRQLAGRMPN